MVSKGLVQPHDTEAEESVLGAMLMSTKAAEIAAELLLATDFYRGSHGVVFTAACTLLQHGDPVDPVAMADLLDQTGQMKNAGGRERLHELVALVPAASNVAHYARIVKEMAMLRELIEAGQDISRLGWERPGDIENLVDSAEQRVFGLSQKRVSSDFVSVKEMLDEGLGRIADLYESGEEVTGTPTGFHDLDKITSGLQPGNLIILASRPSMGKSALGINIAANLGVRKKIPVGMFTLEMSKTEVTQRLVCGEAKVDSQRIANGRLVETDWGRVAGACDQMMRAPIYVDDSGSTTMVELRSKARRLKSREPNLGLLVVDYLQLMASGSKQENRVQEVSLISRQLKVLARDLEVPILALSQLSRLVEQRHDKRPILSDLRESGSLEQDADLVFFIYRDEYYNHEESESQGQAELILAKNRHGPTGVVKVQFVERFAKFTDPE